MIPDLRNWPRSRWIWLCATLVVIVTAVLIARMMMSSGAATSGAFPGVTEKLAAQMQLTGMPTNDIAPAFTLTDQYGHAVNLAGLHGKIVVLTFMDPHCTDICPLISQMFLDAYRDLGPMANKVVFVAVNVNQYHASVGNMAAFSSSHGLNAIPTWHFVTGPTQQLSNVWQGYNVSVQAPTPNADIVHTSVVYFIDAHGVLQYAAAPTDTKTASGTGFLPVSQLTSWGQGIADVTRYMASH